MTGEASLELKGFLKTEMGFVEEKKASSHGWALRLSLDKPGKKSPQHTQRVKKKRDKVGKRNKYIPKGRIFAKALLDL